MRRSIKALVLFVIVFHLLAFVFEVFLWMQPTVHEFALRRLTVPIAIPAYDQALVLKTLFINQGFYNLFLALAGVVGLSLVSKGQSAGTALYAYMCCSALGAGIMLALTTTAYPAAFLQAAPAALVLLLLLRRDRTSTQ